VSFAFEARVTDQSPLTLPVFWWSISRPRH